MMKISSFIGTAVVITALSTPAFATVEYDQNVTPDVIFGSGNANGNFTVDRNSGVNIELGLRAKIPFVGTTHSNGDGTYSYSLAEADPLWNFDWTVNTSYASSLNDIPTSLDSYTYEIGIDFDPGLGQDFFTFDPINVLMADHSIGNNLTLNGHGTEAANSTEYLTLIKNNNVLQNSWRHAFFTADSGKSYDPSMAGVYDIYLAAYSDVPGAVRQEVARTQIRVFIGDLTEVPEPAPFALLGLSLVALGLYRRKKA